MIEKSERITVRLTPGEEEWIVKKAEKAGVSKSRYIRKVTLCELPQSDNPFYEKDRPMNLKNGITHAKMMRIFNTDISQIGNNLNQIARRLNSGEEVDDEMLKEVKQMREELTEIGRVHYKALGWL